MQGHRHLLCGLAGRCTLEALIVCVCFFHANTFLHVLSCLVFSSVSLENCKLVFLYSRCCEGVGVQNRIGVDAGYGSYFFRSLSTAKMQGVYIFSRLHPQGDYVDPRYPGYACYHAGGVSQRGGMTVLIGYGSSALT